MSWVPLRLSAAAPPIEPWRAGPVEGPWVPTEELLHAVAEASDAALVILTGGPEHPDLAAIVRSARAHGLAVAVEAPASRLDAPSLEALGVELLIVPHLGSHQAHDGRLGLGDHAAVEALLAQRSRPRVRVRTRLAEDTSAELAAAAAAGRAEALLVHGGDLPAAAQRAALDGVWRALQGAATTLELVEVAVPPDLVPGGPRDLDDHLLSLRLGGGWLPGLAGGVHANQTPTSTRALAHALGMPPRDPAWHAPDLPPPAGDVVVIAPYLGDALLAASTLPALAEALRAEGASVRFESVWEAPWNLHAPDAFRGRGDRLRGLHDDEDARATKRRDTARKLSPRLLQRLDLSDAGLIVVPGWEAAHAVLHHPSRPPHARVEVVDLHLLDGVERWVGDAGRPELGRWWPEADVTVASCFPAFAGVYVKRGVPIERLRWRPYPVAPEHLPDPIDPTEAGIVLSAGNQRRAHALLEAAAERLDDHRPLHVISAAPPRPVGPILPREPVSLTALVEAVAQSRFVVLPIAFSPTDAAGITLAALALALGRPVVGTAAWGLVDHVPHGRAGLLVPPDDPAALAAAIQRLSRDDGLLAEISAGARAAARHATPAAWARGVLGEASRWPER